ncbi:MAG: hypothetical protein COS99_07665 [Candidatus Omnitrophica bacterium CG07_land_8_20_14_0_80_42_15]|uniref:Phosphodiester glycosidase domain-containing protein n=1 Tax=Candidatus Aquitaenariimonas noxiae TaxID=1974741 RepID=A0A2J0KQY7_9BACT|nr:MAG: hypothetical protein COS99_07665 [Candidatus Omnitrophica bacterium CG07_land_8_20_14_0_80_42_15]
MVYMKLKRLLIISTLAIIIAIFSLQQSPCADTSSKLVFENLAPNHEIHGPSEGDVVARYILSTIRTRRDAALAAGQDIAATNRATLQELRRWLSGNRDARRIVADIRLGRGAGVGSEVVSISDRTRLYNDREGLLGEGEVFEVVLRSGKRFFVDSGTRIVTARRDYDHEVHETAQDEQIAKAEHISIDSDRALYERVTRLVEGIAEDLSNVEVYHSEVLVDGQPEEEVIFSNKIKELLNKWYLSRRDRVIYGLRDAVAGHTLSFIRFVRGIEGFGGHAGKKGIYIDAKYIGRSDQELKKILRHEILAYLLPYNEVGIQTFESRLGYRGVAPIHPTLMISEVVPMEERRPDQFRDWAESGWTGKEILVIENDVVGKRLFGGIMKAILEGEGYIVWWAGAGTARHVRERLGLDFSAVIADSEFARTENGAALLDEFRAQGVPVVLTVNISPTHIARIKEVKDLPPSRNLNSEEQQTLDQALQGLAFEAVVPKPFARQEFLDAIDRVTKSLVAGAPVEIAAGVREAPIRFSREGRFAKGFVVLINPEYVDIDVAVCEGVREYDANADDQAWPGKRIDEVEGSLTDDQREKLVLLGPANLGDFIKGNTAIIQESVLITKTGPGSYQDSAVPLDGDFYFMVLDAGETGLRVVNIKDGIPTTDINHIKLAISGPPLVQDGKDISDLLHFSGENQPVLRPCDVSWDPGTTTAAFAAIGRAEDGRLLYLAIAGDPRAQPELYAREVASAMVRLGAKDALMIAGSAQVVAKAMAHGELVESVAALAHPGSQRAETEPGSRKIGTWLRVLAKPVEGIMIGEREAIPNIPGAQVIPLAFATEDSAARGLAVIAEREAVDVMLLLNPNVVGYNFNTHAVARKFAAAHGKEYMALPGISVPEARQTDAVLSPEERENAILIAPATQAGFWMPTTIVIENGQLIKKTAPGIHQTELIEPDGEFYFFVFDAGKVGMQVVHIDNGVPREDISDIQLAIAGPPLIQDGNDVSDRIEFAGENQPIISGRQVNWRRGLRVPFTAFGCDEAGNLIYFGLAGNSDERPEVTAEEMARVGLRLGAKNLILSGGGPDVQVDIIGHELVAPAAAYPTSETGAEFAYRPLGTILCFVPTKGEGLSVVKRFGTNSEELAGEVDSKGGKIYAGLTETEVQAIDENINKKSDLVRLKHAQTVENVADACEWLIGKTLKEMDQTRLTERERGALEDEAFLEMLKHPGVNFRWFNSIVNEPDKYYLGSDSALAVDLVEFLFKKEIGGWRNLILEYVLHEALEKSGLRHEEIVLLTTKIFNPDMAADLENGRIRRGQTPLGLNLKEFINREYVTRRIACLTNANIGEVRERIYRVDREELAYLKDMILETASFDFSLADLAPQIYSDEEQVIRSERNADRRIEDWPLIGRVSSDIYENEGKRLGRREIDQLISFRYYECSYLRNSALRQLERAAAVRADLLPAIEMERVRILFANADIQEDLVHLTRTIREDSRYVENTIRNIHKERIAHADITGARIEFIGGGGNKKNYKVTFTIKDGREFTVVMGVCKQDMPVEGFAEEEGYLCNTEFELGENMRHLARKWEDLSRLRDKVVPQFGDVTFAQYTHEGDAFNGRGKSWVLVTDHPGYWKRHTVIPNVAVLSCEFIDGPTLEEMLYDDITSEEFNEASASGAEAVMKMAVYGDVYIGDPKPSNIMYSEKDKKFLVTDLDVMYKGGLDGAVKALERGKYYSEAAISIAHERTLDAADSMAQTDKYIPGVATEDDNVTRLRRIVDDIRFYPKSWGFIWREQPFYGAHPVSFIVPADFILNNIGVREFLEILATPTSMGTETFVIIVDAADEAQKRAVESLHLPLVASVEIVNPGRPGSSLTSERLGRLSAEYGVQTGGDRSGRLYFTAIMGNPVRPGEDIDYTMNSPAMIFVATLPGEDGVLSVAGVFASAIEQLLAYSGTTTPESVASGVYSRYALMRKPLEGRGRLYRIPSEYCSIKHPTPELAQAAREYPRAATGVTAPVEEIEITDETTALAVATRERTEIRLEDGNEQVLRSIAAAETIAETSEGRIGLILPAGMIMNEIGVREALQALSSQKTTFGGREVARFAVIVETTDPAEKAAIERLNLPLVEAVELFDRGMIRQERTEILKRKLRARGISNKDIGRLELPTEDISARVEELTTAGEGIYVGIPQIPQPGSMFSAYGAVAGVVRAIINQETTKIFVIDLPAIEHPSVQLQQDLENYRKAMEFLKHA